MTSNIGMHRLIVRLMINKRYLIPRVLIGLVFVLGVYRMSAYVPDAEDGKLYGSMHGIGEKKVKACRFPQLLVDDPLIRKYFAHEPPLVCRQETNWVYFDHGRFYISQEAKAKHGDIECDFSHIERLDDDDHYSETKHENIKNGTPLIGEMSRVVCRAEDGARYENLHVGVPIPKEKTPEEIMEESIERNSTKGLKVNVLMYLLDSMSRMHFIRKLPKFYRFLTDEFKGFLFEGYNIVGDSTTAALIPMTTGYFQTELHEGRKRHQNATHLDDWPFIFKEYMAHQYVTSYIEEQAWTNAFHLRLKGFKDPPVDHYMRPLLIAYENQKRKQKPYCLGDTPESIVWLDYFRQLQDIHGPTQTLHYTTLFTSETSHDFYNKVQVLDEHLVNTFGRLLHGGYFNDTIVFVMSDHGHRHVTTRATQSGKWEERLPFLFVRPPPWFCSKYPNICENMRSNSDSLVTAFDLHATLQHILDFGPNEGQGPGAIGDLSQRGISIFKRIPEERTCAHAAISAHFCSCLEWEEIQEPAKDEFVLGAAEFVVEKFNEKTNQDLPGVCANLTTDKVLSARHLQPNEKLLAWKESLDYDNFFPDLSDNSSLAAVIYQIHFQTLPGPGDWEVSVTYFTELKKYAMSWESVSRVNRYGDQARCVIDEYPHLRMFCYCLRDKP